LSENTVWHNEDEGCPDIDNTNNCSGFDLLVETPTGEKKRIQSKLRQVKGKTPTSQQTHFETTRRNSEKNKEKNHSGHVSYSPDEFDYVLVSLIHVKHGLSIREDVNKWTYSLIPIETLVDPKRPQCCVNAIPAKVLEKYVVKDFTSIRF
jgi:hypothetical protein